MNYRNQKPKILVTGGAGFIGSHIVDELIAQEYPVVIVDNLFAGRKENINPKALRQEDGCAFYHIDVRDPNLDRIFTIEKPEYVFHLAAQIELRRSVVDPLHDADINVIGGINLLKNCIRHKIKKVIFSSSGGAIFAELPEGVAAFDHTHQPNPVSPYGQSKLIFEQYLKYCHDAHGLNYVSLRYSNVYGPRQDSSRECGVISIFTGMILKGEQPTINGDGLATRDYVYVKDVVDANIKALELHENGVFNVATRTEVTVNEVFDRIVSLTQHNIEKKYGPAKKGDVKRNCLDYSLTEKVLGWKPATNIEKGLAETIQWFQQKPVVPAGHIPEFDNKALNYAQCQHWLYGTM